MAWNDTFDESTDWSSVEFMQMFGKALNERRAALGLTLRFLPVAGDDVSFAGDSWQGNTGATAGQCSFTHLQKWLEEACSTFLDVFSAPSTHAPPAWTLATWRAAAGIHANGFRRKKPREVTSTTALTDTNGNVRAPGQRAWFTSGGALSGKLVVFDGTLWTDAGASGPVDVLDSEDAAPDHVPHGRMQAGDYIGPWIWNEIRDGFNLLVALGGHTSSTGGPNVPYTADRFSTAGHFTWDAAKAACEAGFNLEDLVGPAGNGFGTYRYGRRTITSGTTWSAVQQGFSTHLAIPAPATPGIARKFTVWALGHPDSSMHIWNDCGTGIAPSIDTGSEITPVYTNIGTFDEDGSGTVLMSSRIGEEDPSVLPWPTQDQIVNEGTLKFFTGGSWREFQIGFGCDGAKFIIRYDVPGGFRHVG